MAPIVAYVLFALQAAFPIFPYLILAAAAGMLFGFKLGVLLSWAGALTGACLAYGICRILGSDRPNNFIKKHLGYDARDLDKEMAFWSILIARVIPVIPTPVINVAAAISEVPFWNFFFSSALGKLPTAVLYTGLGICLFNAKDIKLVILILAAVLLLALAVRFWGRKRLHLFH
ncbi:membrane spanning protein [hydrocarbon metagenome]|uniref:Membrane spanning protein n=1 Tax=hydrocarbon metagenome TaxID=938273 RepID=A0A0W8E6U0_9ZZZZ